MSGTTRRIVKKRTVKGFWNCKYCGTTKINGLVDYCPNCGVHKPTGTKHDLDKNNIVEVSKEELKAAGIVHSEDGTKRPEWSCKHCDSMNNWLDDVCHSCGAPKRKKENIRTCMLRCAGSDESAHLYFFLAFFRMLFHFHSCPTISSDFFHIIYEQFFRRSR